VIEFHENRSVVFDALALQPPFFGPALCAWIASLAKTVLVGRKSLVNLMPLLPKIIGRDRQSFKGMLSAAVIARPGPSSRPAKATLADVRTDPPKFSSRVLARAFGKLIRTGNSFVDSTMEKFGKRRPFAAITTESSTKQIRSVKFTRAQIMYLTPLDRISSVCFDRSNTSGGR
jgi:hypothetical protein